MTPANQPLLIQPAPDPAAGELEPLLSEPFASAWHEPVGGAQAQAHGRGRLLQRLAASRQAAAAMHTVRLQAVPASVLAPGVSARTLYTAPQGRPQRPGEPLRARLVELGAGASWACAADAPVREWLVLRGSVRVGHDTLRLRDYHVQGGRPDAVLTAGDEGALLFLRESIQELQGTAFTVHDADETWSDYAPGIQRRVLWAQGGQAAMLYYTQPGALVPLHSHGHDEECLMVQGELFLDDVLLQEGDYQLAPAGTRHHTTQTDTGVVLYAHGDLDLRFEA